MKEKSNKTGLYFIELHKWRSILALIACVITFGCSIYAIDISLVSYVRSGRDIVKLFRYFTTLSNTITGTASAFIFPFAVNGIRMKRFVYPKWLSMLHYSGTVCTTLTFIFAMVFILPFNRDMAIGGGNFYLHIICPIAVLICFLLVEDDYEYSKKDMIICLSPFFVYSILYITEVVFIGESNGGWNDLYMLNTFVPFYVSFPAVYLLAFFIAIIIRKTSNNLIKSRKETMLSGLNTSVDPLEMHSDVFSMGKYCGLHDDENDLTVPYDILDMLGQRFSVDTDELVTIYAKGINEGMRERKNNVRNKKSG